MSSVPQKTIKSKIQKGKTWFGYLLNSRELGPSTLRVGSFFITLFILTSYLYHFVAGIFLAFASGFICTMAQAAFLYSGRDIAEKLGPYKRSISSNILFEYSAIKEALAGKPEYKELLNRIILSGRMIKLSMMAFFGQIVFRLVFFT